MLKRRPNGVSRHDVARTGKGPSGGFAEGSLRALVDRDNGEIVVVLPRLVISCYLLPLLPSLSLSFKVGTKLIFARRADILISYDSVLQPPARR